jgi:hypothetical protein
VSWDEWLVVVAGAFLIAGILWFFFAGKRDPRDAA